MELKGQDSKLMVLVVTLLQLFVYGIFANQGDSADCPGLHNLANRFSNPPTIAKDNVKLTCIVDKNCSGLHCSGTVYNKQIMFSLKMEHCKPPMSLKMHIQVPAAHINVRHELVEGNTSSLSFGTGPGALTFTSTPHFERSGDIVTMNLNLCGKLDPIDKCLIKWPVNTSFNIKKELCDVSGDTTPSTPEPEPKVTTAQVSRGSKPFSRQPSGKPITPGKPSLSTRGRGITLSTQRPSEHPVTHGQSGTGRPHPASEPSPTLHEKHTGRKEASQGLSVGGKVAIIASAGLILFVIIGVLFYCKKYKQRRPAFYNDIAINDPLRGDIYDGDEEPLFNSHLVL